MTRRRKSSFDRTRTSTSFTRSAPIPGPFHWIDDRPLDLMASIEDGNGRRRVGVQEEESERRWSRMATIAERRSEEGAGSNGLRWGSWLMALAAVGFIGYAVI